MRIIVNNKLKNVIEVFAFLAADLISIFIIFKLAVIIRTGLLPHIYAGFPTEFPYQKAIDNLWLFVVWILFFIYEGLYTKRVPFWDEVKAIWKVAIYSVVSICVIVTMGKLSAEISRTVVLLMGLLAMGIIPTTRIILKNKLRRIGLLKRRALILGAGETGQLILTALKKEPNYGYDIRGFIDDAPELYGRKIDGLKVHYGLGRTERYISRCGIQDIFIAIPEAGWEKMQSIINNLQHKAERILFVPGIFGIAVLGTRIHHFFNEQTFALEVKNNLAEPLNIFIKRCSDFIICLLFLPALFLLTCLIAVLIKLDSKGSVIFRQERIGKNGKPFMCYKFRTMYTNAEEKLEEVLEIDPKARREWENHWKLSNDPRVTKLGKFLRMTSLDETPQIFNVLKGEMSIVGPRPYLPRERKFLDKYGEIIHSVYPGITGLWQVSGRSHSSYEHRLALDSWYVRNWNLWIDIVIIFRTIGTVLRKDGAM